MESKGSGGYERRQQHGRSWRASKAPGCSRKFAGAQGSWPGAVRSAKESGFPRIAIILKTNLCLHPWATRRLPSEHSLAHWQAPTHPLHSLSLHHAQSATLPFHSSTRALRSHIVLHPSTTSLHISSTVTEIWWLCWCELKSVFFPFSCFLKDTAL